jgi:nucleoside-diphosphate-sugar epimerase
MGIPVFRLYYKIRGVKNFILYPNAVKKLQTSRSYSNLKAKKELDFNPVIDFDTSVKKTVLWLKAKGELKLRL